MPPFNNRAVDLQIVSAYQMLAFFGGGQNSAMSKLSVYNFITHLQFVVKWICSLRNKHTIHIKNPKYLLVARVWSPLRKSSNGRKAANYLEIPKLWP